MTRLANINWRDAVRAFEKNGWQVLRRKGSHIILKKEGFAKIVIPAHRELSPYLLLSQIKRAGMTLDEFIKLL